MSDLSTHGPTEQITPVMRWTFYLAAGMIMLAGLKFASSIVGPLILSLVIVLGVAPVQAWLISKGWRPVLAFVVTLLGVLVAVIVLFAIIGIGMAQFVASLPQYQEQLSALLAQINASLSAAGITVGTASGMISSDQIMAIVGAAASWIAGIASSWVLTITLLCFMLFDALTFQKKLDAVVGIGVTDRVMGFVVDVQKWVTITAVVNSLVAVFNTIFLMFMGIPFALLWGVLSFILGFIPNIGFLLSLIPPAFLALVEYGPREAMIVIVAFILINGGVQNIVTPKMMGEGLDLSPFVVIFSLIFWAFLLGPLGGLMAIPLTLVLRLGLESSPDTRGVAYLLGGGVRPYEGASD